MDCKLLNAKEVASLCGVDRSTIARWLKAGGMPAPIRPGRAPRWSRAVIENWLNPNPKEKAHD